MDKHAEHHLPNVPTGHLIQKLAESLAAFFFGAGGS